MLNTVQFPNNPIRYPHRQHVSTPNKVNLLIRRRGMVADEKRQQASRWFAQAGRMRYDAAHEEGGIHPGGMLDRPLRETGRAESAE